MKNFMIKSLFAIGIASLIAWSCSQNIFDFGLKSVNHRVAKLNSVNDDNLDNTDFIQNIYENTASESLYGAYLAGRVAHLRQDFETAAKYYKEVLDKDTSNSSINRTIYVMLSLRGEINEAAPYARKEIELGNTESIAPLIVAIQDFADGKYADSRKSISLIKDKTHQTIVIPLFKAWTYAGEKNETAAIAEIDKIDKNPALQTTKLFHKGLIYDYMGNTEKAQKMFDEIVKKHYQNVTYRLLEIITDFYVRNGNRETAEKIFKRYSDDSLLAILLNRIEKQMENTHENSPAIIDTPNKGMAEAMFNIGTLFRSSTGSTEFARIYIAASTYLNPDYDISKIALANVLEEIGMIEEANKYYLQIGRDSASYFIARAKMIENLTTLKKYNDAEKQIRLLLRDYPDNTQLLNDLGNVYADMERYQEAVKYYEKAIKTTGEDDNDAWSIYYSLAVSYDKLNRKAEAEQNLQKALILSNQNPNILNYLGYSWLEQGRNIDQAIRMIFEAYNKYPYENHIMDSVGWAYFRLGMYDKAVSFLEQAAALNPGNAVINDHLGDAYWFAGRKNEAVFQWNHALDLKEDADVINKSAIKEKIQDGPADNIVYKVQNPELIEILENTVLFENK